MAVLMGGIAVSFAIWGIGDIFRGGGRNFVAKVGNNEIGIETFRQFYNDQVQQLSRQLGRVITPDQARGIGLDRQVLSRMVAETALDEQARALRLGVPDTEIVRRITADPNFQGAGGFDRTRFELFVRNRNLTEARFVDEQKRVTLRRQIGQSVSGDLAVPQSMIDAVNRFRNGTRSIEFVTLTAAQAGDVGKPTPEVLTKYFEERKILFRAPEYRKITLLTLQPADFAKPDKVSDEEAKVIYERNKDSFGTPEKRALRQIVFPNEDEAKAASERLAKGLSFADLAKERSLKDSDIDLGTVSKRDIIDPAIADAAFAMKPNTVSAPIKGQFGTVILQLTKIEPGDQKSYEQVAALIKKEIAENRARNDVSDLRNKIEDERAGGATLAEAAKKLNLTARSIDAVDRSGRAPDGTQIANLPQGADAIAAAFSADVGVDSDPLQMQNGGLVFYDVAGITPAKDRTLDEVKEQVEKRWRDDETAKRLQAKADDMLGKLKAGATFAQVASESKVSVEKADGLQRGKAPPKLSGKALDLAFRTPKDAAGSAEGNTPSERIVFRVTGVNEPKLDPNSPDAKAAADALRASYVDDLNGQYLAQLENALGVVVNPKGFNQATGAALPDDTN
jgi:peptidyl-prolyl cis-trans isomerase D